MTSPASYPYHDGETTLQDQEQRPIIYLLKTMGYLFNDHLCKNLPRESKVSRNKETGIM